jgi:hypothetical protein
MTGSPIVSDEGEPEPILCVHEIELEQEQAAARFAMKSKATANTAMTPATSSALMIASVAVLIESLL